MQKAATPGLAKGVYAALVTPRRPDTVEADTAAYLEYLDKIAAAGVDGLVFFGSTGEFVHFDIPERMRVISLAAKRSRVPVLVNISHSTFAGARDLAEQAIDAGVSGLLLMPPYFFPQAEQEIRAFYEGFAAAIAGRIPIYLYNMPRFTTAIPARLLGELLSTGAFAGVKDSSGEWDLFESLLETRARRPFRLLIGHEGIYVRALQAGLDGMVSGLAAAVPELVVSVQAAGAEQNPEVASRLDEFLSRVSQLPATIGIKEAADARGWLKTTAAGPLGPETQQRVTAFRSWFESWLPETLQLCRQTTVRT